MTKHADTFAKLCDHFRRIALLSTSSELLEWDERTGMPRGAAEYRAEQVTLLRGMVHRMKTEPVVEEWLDDLTDWDEAADPATDHGATVRRLREDFEREQRLPNDLVEAIAGCTVRGQGLWDAARKADDYTMFQPALDEMLGLKREAGAALAVDGQSSYEALLQEYEPGARVTDLTNVFSSLRGELVDLLSEIQGSSRKPDTSLLNQDFPVDAQRSLSHKLAEAIGFDFHRGRLDETSHPFCTGLGPSDCRILTRYDARGLPTAIFGTLHEAGHGLYDQGLRSDWFGLPPGSYVSLGIHESQSRLWENLVGRSFAFWQHFLPLVQATFPSQFGTATAEQLHGCFNQVRPSLIRVEADEATYNLHIIVRFELEQALIGGELSTDDLPEAWDQKYETVVGIKPPSAADGVLQDVHWSAGLFGYFPTYTLGNLASAQLYDAASAQLGDLDAMISKGSFSPLLEWLRTNVHQQGRCLDPNDLIEKATGKPLTTEPLMNSLRTRYASVYDIRS